MKTFGFIKRDTPLHRLTGASKLILIFILSLAAMITFDTRFLIFTIIISLTLFFMSKIKLSDFKVIVVLLVIFMVMNNIAIYLFAPEQGTLIYGTRTELAFITNRYRITSEQLFYQLNVTLKYFAVMPIALIFFLTTEPSEFASSLNTIKVNYKVAFAVSLSLRYIPDVQRAYRDISQAQQARGVDISKKAPLRKRLAGVLTILFPLVFSSMDKIELVSNAMELRGFGRLKRRTWYNARPFKRADFFIIGLSILCLLLSIFTIIINNGRFYNPF
jgi:energy-coupling factor transport system permease protein